MSSAFSLLFKPTKAARYRCRSSAASPSISRLSVPRARSMVSTSMVSSKARALVYSDRGEAADVLTGVTYDLPPPSKDEARVKFILSPQNPADLNVIQGSYPERPRPKEYLSSNGQKVFIGGNEGLAVIEALPRDVETRLKVGDWVIMGKPQQGTWTSHSNLSLGSLFPIPKRPNLSSISVATLSVNPGTAYRLLKDFSPLRPGDYIMQNGANSQVGLAVIQLARAWGIRTINFVRDRDNIDALRAELHALGADHVFTYEELQAEGGKPFKSQLKSLLGEAPLPLAFNCVSGPDTTAMLKLLSPNGQLVTYGGMSMKPVSVPSSLFIFKNLVCKGFWMTNWYARCAVQERTAMYEEILDLMARGQFRETQCEVVELKGSDEQLGQQARQAIKTVKNKKVVFKFADDV